MRAADDFATIRAKLEELRKGRGEATEKPTTNLKGDVIGACWLCQKDCTPCNGACYGC